VQEVSTLVRRLCVDLPAELAERLDEVVELFDFGSEERFVEVAVRRLLDDYTVLVGKRVRMMT
jgi:metal-responsive CopG/Arc/MetJ family transcriptional regulator